MWPRKYGWLNFAILECSLNVWIVNKIVFAAPELCESALPNPKFLLHCRKWRNINLSWRKFQTSISSTLRKFFKFLNKNLQTWSVDPTKHFGIYFGYIRRLFQSWVSPFNRCSLPKTRLWHCPCQADFLQNFYASHTFQFQKKYLHHCKVQVWIVGVKNKEPMARTKYSPQIKHLTQHTISTLEEKAMPKISSKYHNIISNTSAYVTD